MLVTHFLTEVMIYKRHIRGQGDTGQTVLYKQSSKTYSIPKWLLHDYTSWFPFNMRLASPQHPPFPLKHYVKIPVYCKMYPGETSRWFHSVTLDLDFKHNIYLKNLTTIIFWKDQYIWLVWRITEMMIFKQIPVKLHWVELKHYKTYKASNLVL